MIIKMQNRKHSGIASLSIRYIVTSEYLELYILTSNIHFLAQFSCSSSVNF